MKKLTFLFVLLLYMLTTTACSHDAVQTASQTDSQVVEAYGGQLYLFSYMSYYPFKGLDSVLNSPDSEFRRIDADTFRNSMNGWRLLTTKSGASNLQLCVYENKETYVIALRGTEGILSIDMLENLFHGVLSLAANTHVQRTELELYLGNTLDDGGIKEYLDSAKAIYITGHSLGGYLSYVAANWMYWNGYGDKIQSIVVFNGEGINRISLQNAVAYDFVHADSFKNKIKRYVIEGDFVGDFPCDHLVDPIYVESSDAVLDKYGKHHLLNFADYFNFRLLSVEDVPEQASDEEIDTNEESQLDWRQIYFDNFDKIIKDSYESTWGEPAYFGYNEWVNYYQSCRLADVNFDGIPEFLISFPAPTTYYGCIYRITEEGQVQRIFQDSFDVAKDLRLAKDKNSGELAYILITEVLTYFHNANGFYVMNNWITFNENWKANSFVAECYEEYPEDDDFNPVLEVINGEYFEIVDESMSTYTYMNRSVSRNEFKTSIEQWLSQYELLDGNEIPGPLTRGYAGDWYREHQGETVRYSYFDSKNETSFNLSRPNLPKTDSERLDFLNSYEPEY